MTTVKDAEYFRYSEIDSVTLSGFEEDGDFYVVIDEFEMTATAENNGLFEDDHKRIHFKLTASHDTLSEVERRNVLNCTLGSGNYDPKTEKVTPVDIFIDNKYVEITKIEYLSHNPLEEAK